MASDPQEPKTDTKRPEALPLERMETINKDITVEVIGAAGNIEQEVEASVVVQRIETIGQDVQALQSVQIVEKDIKPIAEFLLYVANFLRGYDGQVGFAIVLLAFFYYFAVILLLGAEVNAFFAEGKHATSADLATLVHASTSPEQLYAQARQSP